MHVARDGLDVIVSSSTLGDDDERHHTESENMGNRNSSSNNNNNIGTSASNSSGKTSSNVWNGYQLGRIVGKGEFATVRLAIDLLADSRGEAKENLPNADNRLVAIKFIKLIPRERQRLKREALILASLQQQARPPHIVPVRAILGTEDGVAIVMKYCGSGELFDYVERQHGLNERQARFFFAQLVEAVDHLHNVMHVVHRDIKLVSLPTSHQRCVGEFASGRRRAVSGRL